MGTAFCLFGVKRPGCEVHNLLSSVAEVKESTENYVHGQLYRCNTAYIPMVRVLIRSICGVYIYIFAISFKLGTLPVLLPAIYRVFTKILTFCSFHKNYVADHISEVKPESVT